MPETEAVPRKAAGSAQRAPERARLRDHRGAHRAGTGGVFQHRHDCGPRRPSAGVSTLGIQAIPLGIIFMLMYAKVNKAAAVLISGVLVGLLVGMSFWLTGLVIALGALAGEVIWNVANRKRFATMAASFTSIMVGWYLGAFAPLVSLMKDFFELGAHDG